MAMRESRFSDVIRTAFFSLWGVLTLVLIFTVAFLIVRLAEQGEQRDLIGAIPRAMAPARVDTSTDGSLVLLYFADRQQIRLAPEERTLQLTDSTVDNCRIAFASLVEGPRTGVVPTMPPTAKARAMYLLASGELIVDLTRDIEAPPLRSASAEWLLVQSIVHTLSQPALRGENDRPITAVTLLYEGSPMSEGFPSHIVLAEPLRPDPLLVGGG